MINKKIIDFSSRLNFLKPNINFDFNNITNTFDFYNTKLYKSLCNTYNIKIPEIKIFNSKNSAIDKLLYYLNKSHCTIYSPNDLSYKEISILQNYEYDLINIFTQNNRAVKENSLVIFSNPSYNNGVYYDLKNHLKAWNKLNCSILIDESYLDFTTYESVLKYVNKYKNLYVLKNTQNFYCNKNINTTTLISNKQNIQDLSKHTQNDTLSIYDTIYLNESLNDKIFNKTAKAINMKNLLLLKNVLQDSKYIKKIYESNTNFLLVEIQNMSTQDFKSYLKKYNIQIQSCEKYDFLNENYILFCVQSEVNINLLNECLKDFE